MTGINKDGVAWVILHAHTAMKFPSLNAVVIFVFLGVLILTPTSYTARWSPEGWEKDVWTTISIVCAFYYLFLSFEYYVGKKEQWETLMRVVNGASGQWLAFGSAIVHGAQVVQRVVLGSKPYDPNYVQSGAVSLFAIILVNAVADALQSRDDKDKPLQINARTPPVWEIPKTSVALKALKLV